VLRIWLDSRLRVRVRISVKLGLVVAAAYRPLVSTMSLTSYVLNADSGR